MWLVQTASRLHFGLLGLPSPGEFWPDHTGAPLLPSRRFGGAGLMITEPGIRIRAESAPSWQVTGPLAARATAFVRRVTDTLSRLDPGVDLPPRRLHVERAGREHVGLGTGTQLGLAVARLLLASWGQSAPLPDVARWAGRGERSSLGVHGFARGGFLVEGGKQGEELSPLVARMDFPPEWRVVLLVPRGHAGVHGPDERAAFERLTAPRAACEALCRLVLLGLLPALANRDLAGFGQALWDYNARSGEMFAPAQKGIYAGPAVAELVGELRRLGVAGAGQSSWGPGVFGVVGDEEQARWVCERLGSRDADTWISSGCNGGARVWQAG